MQCHENTIACGGVANCNHRRPHEGHKYKRTLIIHCNDLGPVVTTNKAPREAKVQHNEIVHSAWHNPTATGADNHNVPLQQDLRRGRMTFRQQDICRGGVERARFAKLRGVSDMAELRLGLVVTGVLPSVFSWQINAAAEYCDVTRIPQNMTPAK